MECHNAATMGTSKKKKMQATDRHKPRKMVPLPLAVHRLLKEMADRNDRPLSRELKRIITKAAEDAGLPPPEEE